MAARWAEVLGRSAQAYGAAWRIALDEGEIRFTSDIDGRGEGLGAFDVVVHDPSAVRANAAARGSLSKDGSVILAGTRVRLIES